MLWYPHIQFVNSFIATRNSTLHNILENLKLISMKVTWIVDVWRGIGFCKSSNVCLRCVEFLCTSQNSRWCSQNQLSPPSPFTSCLFLQFQYILSLFLDLFSSYMSSFSKSYNTWHFLLFLSGILRLPFPLLLLSIFLLLFLKLLQLSSHINTSVPILAILC